MYIYTEFTINVIINNINIITNIINSNFHTYPINVGHSDNTHCCGYLQTDPIVIDHISNNEQCNNIGKITNMIMGGGTVSQLRLPLENKNGSVNINGVFDSNNTIILNDDNSHIVNLDKLSVPPPKTIQVINKRSYDNKISLFINIMDDNYNNDNINNNNSNNNNNNNNNNTATFNDFSSTPVINPIVDTNVNITPAKRVQATPIINGKIPNNMLSSNLGKTTGGESSNRALRSFANPIDNLLTTEEPYWTESPQSP